MAKEKMMKAVPITEGNLLKNIILFAIPVVLTGVLQLLLTSADNFVVGQFCGSNAIAAIGTAMPVVSLIIEVMIGLSTGASVCTAQAMGSGNKKEVHDVVHTALLVAIIGGLVLGVSGSVMSKQILTWMSVEEPVLGEATTYLAIYFLGLPFMLFYNYAAGILRSTGDTKRPLVYLCISGVVNIALNLFFVLVCGWHIAGVAAATVMSQALCAVIISAHLMRTNEAIRLQWRKLRINVLKLKKILKIGIPAGLQGLVFCLSNVVVQSSINSLGPAVMAGHAAAGNFEAFVYNSMTGFYQSSVTFTAQHMGARKIKRMSRAVTLSALLAGGVGLALNLIILLFGRQLLGIFIVDSAAAIELGIRRMLIICPFHCFCGVLLVYMGAIQSMGATVAPVVISILGSCGIRITWLFTAFKAVHTPEMVFWCYPVSWVCTLIAMMTLYYIVRPIQLRKHGLLDEKE